MKKLMTKLMVAGMLTSVAFVGPASAQDTGGSTGSTGSTGQTTGVEDNRGDDGFNPGWLGLLGLAGLAGLRKPAPTVVHRESTARP